MKYLSKLVLHVDYHDTERASKLSAYINRLWITCRNRSLKYIEIYAESSLKTGFTNCFLYFSNFVFEIELKFFFSRLKIQFRFERKHLMGNSWNNRYKKVLSVSR